MSLEDIDVLLRDVPDQYVPQPDVTVLWRIYTHPLNVKIRSFCVI